MGLMKYCPKCGDITFGKNNECSFCNHTINETEYTYNEYLKNRSTIKQKIKEEYIDNSPEFNEELAQKREEENDKVIHGKGTYRYSQENVPKCPTCGSTNIKRITTLDRAVSVGTLGLLSGKIGKNYECLNCKAKW